MRYDAVIFDLDGTLSDSAPGIRNCILYALHKMGKEIPPDETIRRFLGPPLVESFVKYCGMTEEEAWEATELYRERYIPVGAYENAVYPGIRPLLRALKKQGVFVGIATGKPEQSSKNILDRFCLTPYIDALAGPAPECMHADKAELISRILPKGAHAVMVGDSVTDITGGQQCGLDTIAALWGYGFEKELLGVHPTYGAKNTKQLQQILLGQEIPEKGVFLSAEGMDGCGKTTQMGVIEDVLRGLGFPVYRTREPGGCPVGESIRQILLAKEENGLTPLAEALLFAASRAQHVHDVILPRVNQGEAVVSDRFVDSSIAYQGGGRELGVDAVARINEPAVKNAMPDLTIYLRIDHKTSIARRLCAAVPDRIEQQPDAFFARIEQAYEVLVQKNPERFLVIDAVQSIEAVSEQIRQQLPPALSKKGLL